MSPYSGEHSCRVKSPDSFQADSFRRIKQNKLSIIIGRLKGKTTTTTQAFRYPKEDWTEAQARAHCKEQDGTFEPAKAETQEMEIKDFDYLNPKDNPMIKTEED
uniref:Uncharacterized protein n=1 Tax=viral metagenome TaxID=1070528 RepID=A0A6M3MAE4_9ZZZZ